ncbi:S-layer homology domain-containing protein [uncultured Flavonifractor sp.]|uniref:S-layer homology domain-containing protein n=1 Tax=uncultured Flavonifractor sp. TaxID=1193534 RepID=UPI0026251290|nr:S-layer homology domain-containing protein [uncultured Flavonifractor sp.]
MNPKRRYIAAVLASTLLVLPAAGPAAQALGLPLADGVAIDASTFPDAAFRAWLLDGRNLSGAGADSLLTADELAAIQSLDLSGLGIADLEGIQVFTALKRLNVRNNTLTELDLSANTALTSLDAGFNRLTELELSTHPALRFLHINYNQLSQLDLSANLALEGGGFIAEDNNLLKVILPVLPTMTVTADSFRVQNPAPGYDRVVWSLDEAGLQPVEESFQANGQTLYGKRIANQYTIYFSANDGRGHTAPVQAVYDQETTLTPNGFTRYGYTFQGWNTLSWGAGDSYTDGQSVTNLSGIHQGDRITLYAQWKPVNYTISFDANGGQGNMESADAVYDQAATLPDCGFTNDGMEFAGWATEAGGPVRYLPQDSVKNLSMDEGGEATLYAVWKTPVAEEQETRLTRLQQAFGSYSSQNYAAQDWATLSGHYAQAADAIRDESDNDAMDTLVTDCVSAMSQVPALDERAQEVAQGWQAALSPSVGTELTRLAGLAQQKQAAVSALRTAYQGYDLTEYTYDGQAALLSALEQAVQAVEGAEDQSQVQAAHDHGLTAMAQVPNAEGETPELPPQPETPDEPDGPGNSGNTGSGGSGGGSSGGGSNNGSSGGGSNNGSSGGSGSGGSGNEDSDDSQDSNTVTITDDKTGTVTKVTTGADGSVEAVVTVPQGVDSVVVNIPCTPAAGTVALLVEEDGSTQILSKSTVTADGLAVRLDGSAKLRLTDNSKSFSDVEAGSWYADSVNWAAQAGIVQGVAPGSFAPHAPLTRESLAVLLYRYAEQQGLDLSARSELSGFADSGAVSAWAEEALAWACANGLLEGDGGSLRPGATCTRAEASVILERFAALLTA